LANADNELVLTVANNLDRETIRGTAQILAPQGWHIAPVQVGYDLQPGEFIERKIVVLRQETDTRGAAIAARTTYNGLTYEDMLTIDDAVSLTAQRAGNEIVATVRNSLSLPAQGSVELAIPPIDDPNLMGDRPTVLPARQPVSVGPYDEERLVFRIRSDPAPAWFVLKLAATGETHYIRLPDKLPSAVTSAGFLR
jgi:hypothetical protein